MVNVTYPSLKILFKDLLQNILKETSKLDAYKSLTPRDMT